MKIFFFGIILFSINLFAQQADPLLTAKRIADRIIDETTFNLIDAKQTAAMDLQVIDFASASEILNEKYAYAFAKIVVQDTRTLKFGLSYSSPLKIWINKRLVFQNDRKTKFIFKEIAYSLFCFNDTLILKLNKNSNSIVIGSKLEKGSFIYLRELTGAEENPKSKILPVISGQIFTWPWCFIGYSNNIRTDHRNAELIPLFVDSLLNGHLDKKYSLLILEPKELKKLAVNPNITFKKESFADWTYPNGTLMMTLIKLSDATGDERYHSFVKKYCSFIQDNLSLFKNQYYENHDLRGSYYRIFRKSMLDDAGAPTIPFAEIEIHDQTKDYDPLVNEMANYVMNDQARLHDGTLCRPEPEKWTVWADDLFMSVPLLLRMGILTNQEKYFDEAAKQIINFNKYLFDSKAKLYKHGWFSSTNQKSNVFWGRANGWVVWATSEAILKLPVNHPKYKKIETVFRNHLLGILRMQDHSGVWHQILDDKDSFEETSAAAMFIVGLSRGVMNGILDKSYSEKIFATWSALQNKITADGIVKDICCGTGIGTDAEFYKTRQRSNNDPRGLGAVIEAAIEIDMLKKYCNK